MRKLSLKELNRASPDEFKLQEKTPLIIVLDNVRSGLNVGSAFRTGDAFACAGVYLCGITAHWKYFEKTTDAIQDLREQDYTILAVEQADESVMLQDFEVKMDGKYAVVFGNEVKGVGEEVMQIIGGLGNFSENKILNSFKRSVHHQAKRPSTVLQTLAPLHHTTKFPKNHPHSVEIELPNFLLLSPLESHDLHYIHFPNNRLKQQP